MLVSVSKNTRQRFANLRVGCRRIKKKKQKNRNGSQDPFHAFEKKKKKRALPCDFYLNFSPALPTSLSLSLLLLLLLLFAPSLLPPPHSLLQPAAGNGREEQASERRGVLFLPVSFFFSEAWIKVAFRAAIVRVIRKSYLQRVRVAREETARGMGDEACVCVCVCRGVGLVWVERRFFSWVLLMREITPATFPSVHFEHVAVWGLCVRVITHFHVCACARQHTGADMYRTYVTILQWNTHAATHAS